TDHEAVATVAQRRAAEWLLVVGAGIARVIQHRGTANDHRCPPAGAEVDRYRRSPYQVVVQGFPQAGLLDVGQELVTPAPVLFGSHTRTTSIVEDGSRIRPEIPMLPPIGEVAEDVVMMMKRQADLFEVIGTFRPVAGFAHLLDRWQEQGDEDA